MNLETIYEHCAVAGYNATDGTTSHEARAAFARAAIETYLKLNPFWVKASDRMPTAEDAESGEYLWIHDPLDGVDIAKYRDVKRHQLWTSIKHLPPPPDPFTEWYAKQPSHITSLPKETVKEIYQSLTTQTP